MGEKLEIGLLYLGLHNQLVKTYGNYAIISRKCLFKRFGMHYYVPKNLRETLLKEMQNLNLIERVNRDNIKILPLELNLEEDYNKFISSL